MKIERRYIWTVLSLLVFLIFCKMYLFPNIDSKNDRPQHCRQNSFKVEVSKSQKHQTCLQICQELSVGNNTAEPHPVKFEVALTSGGKGEIRILMNTMHRFATTLSSGGWTYVKNKHHPTECTSQEVMESFAMGVAVIIPFRDRWDQLPIAIDRLVALLQHQRVCYRIFVVEQTGSSNFNRGKLFNIGYVEAKNVFNFGCVVFHDIDLIPMNNDIPYGCDTATQKTVHHLSVAIDARNYTLTYPGLIGGVLKMTGKHFEQVNGFSNLYWGWGQEDDDMEHRLKSRRIPYLHYNPHVARYHAISHERQPKVLRNEHFLLLKTSKKRLDKDGLNSLFFKRVSFAECDLYTHIAVDVF